MVSLLQSCFLLLQTRVHVVGERAFDISYNLSPPRSKSGDDRHRSMLCAEQREIASGHPFVVFSLSFFFFFFFFFAISRAIPTAYGGSQARGLIRAVAAGIHHGQSNMGSEPICNLHHSSRQCQILNPLSKARDRTLNLMVPSRIR